MQRQHYKRKSKLSQSMNKPLDEVMSEKSDEADSLYDDRLYGGKSGHDLKVG